MPDGSVPGGPPALAPGSAAAYREAAGLGVDRRRVFLARLPDSGLGHRAGFSCLGRLRARRLHRRQGPPGDGPPASIVILWAGSLFHFGATVAAETQLA